MARKPRNTLPEPDPEAARASRALAGRIGEAIAEAGGAIGFDRFMAMALYEPGLGYYSAGQARFGAGGDFTTAPLMSALYSRTLARQVVGILDAVDGDEVLEFGAGTGRMAADVLTELAAVDRLPARYRIVEVSAALRQEQARTLAELPDEVADRVEWLDRLDGVAVHGAILANEVLDALPVRRFQIVDGAPWEQVVTADADNGFAFALRPADAELAEAVAGIEADLGERLPEGYVSEWSAVLSGWMAALADVLAAGAALIVDYGYPRHEYYHQQRGMGTLLCHYRHRAHDDALILPGLQDITAFVDFTRAARCGAASGLEVAGYTTQAHFLMGAGLTELLDEAMGADPEQGMRLAQQAKPLLFPGGLGERFKVLALARGLRGTLAGFSLFDHTSRLGV